MFLNVWLCVSAYLVMQNAHIIRLLHTHVLVQVRGYRCMLGSSLG